ncbi:MAG: hypothetical protein U0N62_09275 [Hydrogeniiclostridium sp.]
MLGERILPLDPQRAAVEIPVFVEIGAEKLQKFPAILGTFDGERDKIGVKNPVYQIKFVPKMVIEAFTVHSAFFANHRHADFFEGDLFHQLLERRCKRALGYIGICHRKPFFLFADRYVPGIAAGAPRRGAAEKEKDEAYLRRADKSRRFR